MDEPEVGAVFLYDTTASLGWTLGSDATEYDEGPLRVTVAKSEYVQNVQTENEGRAHVDVGVEDLLGGFRQDNDCGDEEYISLRLDDEDNEAVVPAVPVADEPQEKQELEAKPVATGKKRGIAPPWAKAEKSRKWIHSPFLQLHQDILDFTDFVTPTEDEKASRAAAVQRVTSVVQSIWPTAKVELFGSFATGLYLPTSDCDMVVLNSGVLVPVEGLRALAKGLSRKSLVKNLQVIAKAKVPIVKFVETESNISFDISFDVANGPEAAAFIREAIDAWPPLKPLCMVLKIFLQQRELNEVYTGGIGSYALLTMLIAHLQLHPSWREPQRDRTPKLESNLGILLVDFFELYGRQLNMRDVGVSCRDGGIFYSKRAEGKLDSQRSYLLSVEDPQDRNNDICKNSFNISKVRSAFLHAARLLTSANPESTASECDGMLSRIIRIDSILSKRTLAYQTSLNPTPGTSGRESDEDDEEREDGEWEEYDDGSKNAKRRGSSLQNDGGSTKAEELANGRLKPRRPKKEMGSKKEKEERGLAMKKKRKLG